MPLQPPNFFGLLDTTNPTGTDSRTISDDYHRMIQQSCKNQGPNWNDVINATHADLNLVTGLAAAGAKLLTGNAGLSVAFRYQNTADIGWTIEEPDANLRELVIGPAAGGGAIGGAIDPTELTQTATVTVSSLTATAASAGAHAHGSGTLQADPQGADYNALSGAVPPSSTGEHGHTISGSVSTDGVHTHTVSGTGAGTADISISPRYARGILQKLDP